MLKRLFPNQIVDSIYDVEYTKLYKEGVRGLLFDIDNTLVPCHVEHPDTNIIDLFMSLKEKGFTIALVSNNNKKRVLRFNEKLKLLAYPKAKKPFTRNLKRAMQSIQSSKDTTALIGDQIFTDIYGGNKLGIRTILVNPLSEKEHWFTKIKRGTENKILQSYKKWKTNYEQNR